ncbi:FAD-dependent oxidoreductase [Lactobacillus xylocopicola]|uniref:Fumarate reductase n=1 Tax=Lactobacillus xylocopicola TaxID=2976676 RepID=A0ABN6SHX2_9LACO|nr:FAD-binding protein [Lactobacillus xylocopicola]BDR59891.1 fumarate reductase [Lactobacillus xylocopicola]
MAKQNYDAVIIGLGGAGLAAGVELVEQGKSVLALEKGQDWGGASKWAAEGIFAIESQQQINAGDYTTRDDMFHHLMSWAHWRNNGLLVRKFIDKSADTIDWLQDHGLKTLLVGDVQDYHWGKPGTYHMFIDKLNSFDNLVSYFQAHGGDVLTKASGQELVMTAGKLTGVKYEHHGQSLLANTPVVIVADGGFIGNTEMVKKYVDQDISDWYVAGETKATGDGIQMVHAVGGQMRGFYNFQNHNACVYPTFEATGGEEGNYSINQLYSLPLLWVNRRGERFTDERVVYDSVLWGNVTAKQNGKYFEILDQATLDKFSQEKVPMLNSYTRYGAAKNFIDSLKPEDVNEPTQLMRQWSCDATTGPLSTLDRDWQQATTDGYVLKANDLTELAQQMGVPVSNLESTVARYNEAIANQYDPEFNKDKVLLQFGVDHGPFYAIKVRSAVLGTIGGIEIDENCRAIGENEQVIPGVYVVGANATGMYDNSYSDVEGVTCAFAWNSGRMAAEHAVQYLNN